MISYVARKPVLLIGLLICSAPAMAQMTEVPAYKFDVTRDIVYGEGLIRRGGEQVSRDLWMDAYLPIDDGDDPRPTVIYTHGGSFHIGSPRTAYNVDGAQTTSPEDYCRLFAGLGYACFAIEYRLGPEEPVATGLGYDADLVDLGSAALMMDRLSAIRDILELRPLEISNPGDQALISDTVLAAAEDLNKALNYIIDNAGDFQVDAERIVLGGFSAGAVTSLNVAHGMNAPVAGVFMLSSAPIGLNIDAAISDQSAPALQFAGQYDLSGAIAAAPGMIAMYERVGLDHSFAWVPAFGHFYPAGAVSLGSDGMRMSVEERILEFVARVTSM